MSCTACAQHQASGIAGGRYDLHCLQCCARLVRSARPVRRMQETMLAVVTRREGRPSRAVVLAKVKEVTNA